VCTEFRYLGLYITAAKSFKLNMHQAKMKYFRSLNGILGKIGSSDPINVVLSLVNSFATPVLLYGMESAYIKHSDVKNLNYPYRSIYFKLFSTFNAEIIDQCQYYTGYLPLKYALNLRCLTFFKSLLSPPMNARPAGLLAKWFGFIDWDVNASEHNINYYDSSAAMKRKIWSKFMADLNL
jgi:hypothetical protein